jgi:hypothetical protein
MTLYHVSQQQRSVPNNMREKRRRKNEKRLRDEKALRSAFDLSYLAMTQVIHI